MKRIAFPLIMLALTLLACSITPGPTGEPPVTAPPPVTEPPVTEPPVVTEPPLVPNVTCNELSLYLDPALASSTTCETILESPYEMELYPQHTQLTLVGYPLADKFFDPIIAVFPVAAYTALSPTAIPTKVTDLQALLAVGIIPPFTASFTPGLPFLPLFNAAEVFYARGQVLPFVSGNGIRYLTEFAQYYAPVNNTDLFYTYQGLTNDGQYWISAILPINHAILPANADNPPTGETWEEFSNNYEPYINDLVEQLNAQTPESYLPSLTLLDALVGSITITP